MPRTVIRLKSITDATNETTNSLFRRLDEKGWGSAASIHEVDGILDEEFREFKDAVHDNDVVQQKKELLDIALFAIFGIACLNQKTLDW